MTIHPKKQGDPLSFGQPMQRDLNYINEATNSHASNPGRLRVNYFHYASHFPVWPLIWVTSLMVTIGLIYFHWTFIFGAAIAAVGNYYCWSRVKYHFIGGMNNPSVVVQSDPPLVAVLTDMTKDGVNLCFTIRILEQPIQRTYRPGQPIATIATYGWVTSLIIGI